MCFVVLGLCAAAVLSAQNRQPAGRTSGLAIGGRTPSQNAVAATQGFRSVTIRAL
jgi:hypothetical protein